MTTPETDVAHVNPDPDRFLAMVDKAGPVSPVLGSRCWLWTGATDRRGYPKFWLRGNAVTAQRATLILAGVELLPGQLVINLCGNRGCVRRGHLATGSLEDAHALRHRGTPRVGPGELWLIREAVRDGRVTAEHVVRMFQLSPEFVEQVVAAG